MRRFLLATLLLSSSWATISQAADPIRIGVTTILSGPLADRGQSEQYGIELALAAINQAGGVLGRPLEAVYGDNAADVPTGLRATERLLDTLHVPVLIGALATPVTHAIMPVVAQAKVPLVIEISAGQDFVDASGVGGNPYTFKTIPSDLDIARGLINWLKPQHVQSVVILCDDNGFNRANAASLTRVAEDAGMKVLDSTVVPKGTTDLAPLLTRVDALKPDRLVTVLGPSTAAFFRAYEQSGGTIPVTGRIDFATAMGAVSPKFLADGGLSKLTGITVFNTAITTPGVQNFIQAYQVKYGILPTQRAFFAYEAANLVADAIRRAGAAEPQAIRDALTTSKMPSLLGGTYGMDDHNHSHTPMQIVGLHDGHMTVIADTE